MTGFGQLQVNTKIKQKWSAMGKQRTIQQADVFQDPMQQGFVPHHLFKTKCLSATNFLPSCTGNIERRKRVEEADLSW